MSVIIHNSKK